MRVEPTVAVFTKNWVNPAYAAARLAADRVAAESGANIVHYVPSTPDDVDQQKALVAQALMARPDAVVFVPVDDVAMAADVARFDTGGIPVVLCINRMTDVRCVTFVGSDDVAVGHVAAIALFEALGSSGKVVAIDGTSAAPTSRDRCAGLAKAVREHPGIELVGRGSGLYQQDVARAEMQRLLLQHRRIDGVWTANDVMAYGALEALDAAGRRAELVGVNGLSGAIELIESGRMLATVDFNAFAIVAIATRAALRHLGGRAVPPAIVLPATLIGRANYAAWKVPIAERPCPTWEQIVRE